MNNKDFTGVAGRIIIGFCDEYGNPVKLNEFSDYIETKCPECNRLVTITKEKFNKIITCSCGKKIYVEVSENLL